MKQLFTIHKEYIDVHDKEAFSVAMVMHTSIYKAREAIDACAKNGHNYDKKTYMDMNIWKCKRCFIQYDLDDGKYY